MLRYIAVLTFNQSALSGIVASRMFTITKYFMIVHIKGKAIPLQALTGPEGSRRLSIPDFKTIGT
jgi:hypothetical protein